MPGAATALGSADATVARGRGSRALTVCVGGRFLRRLRVLERGCLRAARLADPDGAGLAWVAAGDVVAAERDIPRRNHAVDVVHRRDAGRHVPGAGLHAAE